MKHVAEELERGDPGNELTLLGFASPEGSYSSFSPFCAKTELMLRICDLEYKGTIGNVQKATDAPKHKVQRNPCMLEHVSAWLRLPAQGAFPGTVPPALLVAIAQSHCVVSDAPNKGACWQ